VSKRRSIRLADQGNGRSRPEPLSPTPCIGRTRGSRPVLGPGWHAGGRRRGDKPDSRYWSPAYFEYSILQLDCDILCRYIYSSMAKSKISEATTSVYEVLEPFEEEERTRIVGAALMLLGQSPQAAAAVPAPKATKATVDHTDSDIPNLGTKAKRWVQQNGISQEMIEQCFHLEPEVPEVVAEIPGTSAREKTANCYLLTGVAALLKTDEPNFADATARALCENAGCFDSTNHTKYTKLGNRATGDKKSGWKLLAPGLKDAATLVKSLAKEEE
jgi:hypothetical protein